MSTRKNKHDIKSNSPHSTHFPTFKKNQLFYYHFPTCYQSEPQSFMIYVLKQTLVSKLCQTKVGFFIFLLLSIQVLIFDILVDLDIVIYDFCGLLIKY